MSLWNGFLGLLLLAVCTNGSRLCAQNPGIPDTSSAKARQVLILKSGRVFTGHIKPRGNGYDIDQAAGKLFVGSEQVWLLADDLTDAHQAMRDSFPTLTPDIHMRIAAWCSDNRMWGTAQQELLDALHKDPFRSEARQMLARVVRQQEAATQSHESTASTAIAEAISNRAVLRGRFLGGLSAGLAGEFTRQIQPLLSNQCAECHHANSDRVFVLKSTRKGSTRAIAERNLVAVLNQLDSATTRPNDFLTMATTQHGTMPAAPFSGRHGELQQERITTWVERTIQEKGFGTPRQPTVAGFSPNVHEVLKTARRTRDSAVVPASLVVSESTPHVATRLNSSLDEELLTDARRRNRKDKFDPDVFNQRYQFRGASFGAGPGQINRRSPYSVLH